MMNGNANNIPNYFINANENKINKNSDNKKAPTKINIWLYEK